MPTIELNYKQIKDQNYESGLTKINVSTHLFNEFSPFIYLKYELTGQLFAEDIYASKIGVTDPGSVIIKNDKGYDGNPLMSAEVYYNRCDKEYTKPLILLLRFKSNGSRNRYYKLLNFDKDRSTHLNISDLDEYTTQDDLFHKLLEENEKITDFLTYNIGMIQNVNVEKYNGDKISISTKQKVRGNYLYDDIGFYKYTHTPNFSKPKQHKSLITYNNRVLKLKNSNNQMGDIGEIQGKQYKRVNVYFGTKAKIMNANVSSDDNVPLMVELVTSDKPNQCEYYCHYQNDKELYWEKLEGSNYEKYTGTKLNYLNQPVNLTINNNHLIKVLKRLEYYFHKTLIIMINNKKKYGKIDVSGSYADYRKSTIINGEDIIVSKSSHHDNYLKNTGFEVYEHDISFFERDDEDYQLKFVIPNSVSVGGHNEITLYNGNNPRSEYIENLVYSENYYNESKIYVYFYGSDSRPLLVSYGDTFYKPRNKEKYLTEWVRIDDTYDWYNGNSSKLLKQLSEVIGFLNEVNLYKHFDYYHGTYYEVHTYDNDKICITLSKISLDCYIKYQHKPKKEQGYRLGNIVYEKDNNKRGDIVYDTSSPLVQVNVYYYNNDYESKYPLLVELEFQNNRYNSNDRIKKYYKLLQSDFHMEWELDHVASRIASDPEKLRKYLDFINHSFNVSELNGVRAKCGHDHSPDPDFLSQLYITSHGTDYFPHVSSSSYTHQDGSNSSHARSNTRSGRSLSYRNEHSTMNHQQGRDPRSQHIHANQAPAVSGVEKATRIASTVGTFALAGTGTGVAIYKYSNWIIALFKKIF